MGALETGFHCETPFYMHFVYILYSPSSDLYYVGESGDVDVRLIFHNKLNPGSFTSKHRPWQLKKTIPFDSQRQAIGAERYIKKRKSRKYIQSLITNPQAVHRLRKRFAVG